MQNKLFVSLIVAILLIGCRNQQNSDLLKKEFCISHTIDQHRDTCISFCFESKTFKRKTTHTYFNCNNEEKEIEITIDLNPNKHGLSKINLGNDSSSLILKSIKRYNLGSVKVALYQFYAYTDETDALLKIFWTQAEGIIAINNPASGNTSVLNNQNSLLIFDKLIKDTTFYRDGNDPPPSPAKR